MRLRRQSESCDAREERLSRQRQRQTESRQNETLGEHQERQEQDRFRHIVARRNESEEERQQRLIADRNRYQNLRQHEIQNAKHSALLYDKNDPCNKAAIGEMTKLCQCGAKKFTGESLGMCCGNGKVTLDQFPPLPQLFEELFTGESQFSKHFLSRLREYNSLFAMTSFGHKDASVQGWNPSVRIQGQIYHQLGSLMPPEDRRARYIQVYFLDTLEDQLRARGEHQNLNADILERITAWLNENNHYVGELKTALEQVRQVNINDKKIVIWENKRAQGEHARRFNAPTGAEVAILMSNEPTENRDIVLQLKQGGLRRISELHRSYDPLMYPLFFPYGTDGYHIYLQGRNGRKVTQLQFYSFHIMCREGNYLLLGRRLFRQFLVDAYCKIETERLKFLRREQQSLRAENYSDLRDSLLAADGDPNQVGRRIVLPATYTGGPRYLHEKRSDAMAFVRH
ncbi:putative Helitron helicase-like domain-containing protein 3 [Homarus americanus]|uniref:Putative Helitron helicase-like domain-containing protein 3 n=1 Tax=Homarus americanus TaxID=6706 RepID=A0A8J5JN79_HOMAM|nr:putative Helitron helicase-like domain-containing protein 3 [Homarus americanus]